MGKYTRSASRAEARENVPHYHPCGHCKQHLNTWPCFADDDADLLKHEGIYHLCEQCNDTLPVEPFDD